jgi:hypothetical protein
VNTSAKINSSKGVNHETEIIARPADLEKVANRARSLAVLGKVSALALGLKDEKAVLQILMQRRKESSASGGLSRSTAGTRSQLK